MARSSPLTPMFRQYHDLKADHPDAVLLFRMGDFYEMFYDDARDASAVLDLTLTARGKGTDNVVPMCGFPHHQLAPYAARLVRAGRRVAVCDQVEDPKQAKGLVKREVVRIVTPGTVLEPSELDAREPSWAAAVTRARGRIGIAFLDATTGAFTAWESPGDRSDEWALAVDRIRAFGPKEVVHPEDLDWSEAVRSEIARTATLTATDAFAFAADQAARDLRRHFGVESLDGFGFRARDAAVAAAGGLLSYVEDTQRARLEHVDALTLHDPATAMRLDPATTRNLELERSLRNGTREGSLLHTIDRTKTAAGARLLREWLLSPLVDVDDISSRHDAVEELLRHPTMRDGVRDVLTGFQDVERLTARVVARTAGPRDLAALRASLERIPNLEAALAEATAALVRDRLDRLDRCEDVASLLRAAIVDDPPAALRDGGVVREGYDRDLDALRAVGKDGRATIASIEAREREATGIASLKVRFNKVFGYFIEVSKANLKLVPEHYVRKQTIANGERFVTPELKDYETRILTAQERIETIETERFLELRERLATEAPRLKRVASTVASIDVLAGFAETAAKLDYARPSVDDSPELVIEGGRHPVVEDALVERRFVPNDTRLTAGADAIAILTGPNMGGKSTYLRQVAVIAVLAQAGSFVPAERAEIGVVDRVFCRVGASDDLAEGQSTFMVEMAETANILHHATPRSLVLLDEIGRGTATFDGLSIAWAVVEHLHRAPGGACRTLFATHYHELTELAVQLEGVGNLRMAVREHGDSVVFTHRVETGAADRSYGIHVARLAGVPDAVVARATEVLAELEREAYGKDGLPRLAETRRGGRPSAQRSLFGTASGRELEPERDAPEARVLRELGALRVEAMTPLEALSRLDAWHRAVAREKNDDGEPDR